MYTETGTAHSESARSLVGHQVNNFTASGHAQVIVGDNYGSLEKTYDWLSSLDFSQKQKIFDGREPGTGKWFLNCDSFQAWVRGDEDFKTLWCPGRAGAGKTSLVSAVVDDLHNNRFKEEDDDARVATIYYDFKARTAEPKLQHSHTNIIQSLLKQLIDPNRASKKVRQLKEDHDTRNVFPNHATCVDALLEQAQQYKRVFIIIDAIDESPECNGDAENLERLQNDLRELKTVVNLMVTCRKSSGADTGLREDPFQDARLIDMDAKEVDLRRYVATRINSPSFKKLTLSNATLEKEVEDRVVAVALGMFLLAKLLMKNLGAITKPFDLKKRLKNLPEGLDDAYGDTMDRIQGQDGERPAMALRILVWLTHALRPLTVREIQHALFVQEEEELPSDDDVTSGDLIREVCAGLVIISGSDGNHYIDTVHSTLNWYLLKFEKSTQYKEIQRSGSARQVQFAESHIELFRNSSLDIATVCLKYLSFERFEEDYCQNDDDLQNLLQEYPFLDYAVRHWGRHMRRVPKEVEDLTNSSIEMLESDSRRLNLSQIMSIPVFRRKDYTQTFPRAMSGLHFAAIFGLKDLIPPLQAHGLDLQDDYGRTPLHLAARNGDLGFVDTLLKEGALIETKTKDGETALLSAAMKGDFKVVQLLVKHKTDVNTVNLPGGTALHWASLNGEEKVVQVLLDNGADITKETVSGQTLSYAQQYLGEGNILTWLLLDTLAAVGVRNLLGGTALHWAAINGREKVVSLLLARRAEVNKKNRTGGTALHAAAWNGNEKVVEKLLEYGADASLRTKLLEYGADTSLRTKLGRGPLREACLNGHKSVIELLVTKGKNVMAEAAELLETTEMELSSMEEEIVVSWLVDKGSEMALNLDKNEEAKKLLEAVVMETEFELLLPLMQTALQETIDEGDDKKGWTALKAASEKGHEALTTLLSSIVKCPPH